MVRSQFLCTYKEMNKWPVESLRGPSRILFCFRSFFFFVSKTEALTIQALLFDWLHSLLFLHFFFLSNLQTTPLFQLWAPVFKLCSLPLNAPKQHHAVALSVWDWTHLNGKHWDGSSTESTTAIICASAILLYSCVTGRFFHYSFMGITHILFHLWEVAVHLCSSQIQISDYHNCILMMSVHHLSSDNLTVHLYCMCPFI